MSFFDNQKNAGIALLVFAILYIVVAVVTIIAEVVDGNIAMASIITAIGTAISGVIYFGFAQKVRSGEYSDKFTIITQFVQAFAYSCFVGGIAAIIAGFFASSYFGTGIIDIIIGALALWIYNKITDNQDSIVDKIAWIILFVVFVLYILGGIIMCIGIITIPLGIAYLIIGIFMLTGLLDAEVKAKFGM